MRRFLTVLSTGLIAASLFVGLAAAAEQPPLGTAGNYAVIGASAITNTGSTTINGNLAISPSGETSVTGFGPGVVTGVSDFNNAEAIAAQVDLGIAYTAAANEPFTVNLTGQDLGSLTLTPGVYRFDSSAQLTGTLILDGEGTMNPTFIFQIGSTLTTASASSVLLINGAGGCAVFWQVGSSATLGTSTSFQGTIMASASITATTGVTVGAGGGSNGGRLLARTAAVTLDSNVVTAPPAGCAFAPAATATPVPTDTPVSTDTPVPTATPSPAPTATAVPTDAPTVPVVALVAIPTLVPPSIGAAPVSPAPSVDLPLAEVPPASVAPSVPNTSISGRFSPRQDTIGPLVAVGLAGIGLSLMAALRRPRRESNPRRRP